MSHKYWIRVISTCFILCMSQANAEGWNLGLNFEVMFPQLHDVTDSSAELGPAYHIGYEFEKRKNWNIGVQYEHFYGLGGPSSEWPSVGALTYKSNSFLITARPNGWPVLLKAGLVSAEYTVVLPGFQNIRTVNDTGLTYGFSFLLFSDEHIRFELLDFKHITIGDDRFNSWAIGAALMY